MDVTELSGRVGNAPAPRTNELHPRADTELQPQGIVQQEQNERPRGELALGVLRQELRNALVEHFRGFVRAGFQSYPATPASSKEVATETLDAAKQASAASPATAASSLISFRVRVHETATYVRQLVGQEDSAPIDDAVSMVDDGLEALGDEVAANRESSASVLHVDTHRKERTTIRIRTQDGDIVKLKLKQVEQFSAGNVTTEDAEGYSSLTVAEDHRRSDLMLKVEGELDEGELEAIRNVLTQAEQIANEFFDGDMAAAFEVAQQFTFDTSELARVKMRFGISQTNDIHYVETQTGSPTPPAESVAPAVEAPSSPVPTPDDNPVPVIGDVPATPAVPAESPAEEQPALQNILAGFLRTVREGFLGGDETGSVQLHFSERFKLDLLQAVVHSVVDTQEQPDVVEAGVEGEDGIDLR